MSLRAFVVGTTVGEGPWTTAFVALGTSVLGLSMGSTDLSSGERPSVRFPVGLSAEAP